MVLVTNDTFTTVMNYLEQHEKKHRFPEWVIRHQKEVFHLSYRVGIALGFSSQQLTDLSIAARFHDIGKSSIDPYLINHSGALSEAQRYEVFEHVRQSYQILKKKGIQSKTILAAVFSHHENFDGSGYPDRLKQDEIPREAQILRIVDSFSAMLGSRPYSNPHATSLDQAISQIEQGSGVLYNPNMVGTFLKIIRQGNLSGTVDEVFGSVHPVACFKRNEHN
ncbi:MAG: HD domain-containing protein [Candidatus Omnitrophica bacterium]|nr:HD domain-containing protein [Candidatus Omnitrophota bacterium]